MITPHPYHMKLFKTSIFQEERKTFVNLWSWRPFVKPLELYNLLMIWPVTLPLFPEHCEPTFASKWCQSWWKLGVFPHLWWSYVDKLLCTTMSPLKRVHQCVWRVCLSLAASIKWRKKKCFFLVLNYLLWKKHLILSHCNILGFKYHPFKISLSCCPSWALNLIDGVPYRLSWNIQFGQLYNTVFIVEAGYEGLKQYYFITINVSW